MTSLRMVRLQRGKRLLDVSVAADISMTRLSLLERGLIQMSEAEQTQLARALQVSPGRLSQEEMEVSNA